MRLVIAIKSASILLFILSGCSLLSVNEANKSDRKLSFQTALELRNENRSATDVLQILGEPGAKKDLGEQGQLWSYFESFNGGTAIQRLGVFVDSKTAQVLSWTWAVQPGENLGDLNALGMLFGGPTRFRKYDREHWAGGHALVRETIYENTEAGVSALIHGSDNRVFVISLSQLHQSNRPIAGKATN